MEHFCLRDRCGGGGGGGRVLNYIAAGVFEGSGCLVMTAFAAGCGVGVDAGMGLRRRCMDRSGLKDRRRIFQNPDFQEGCGFPDLLTYLTYLGLP